MSKKRKPYYVRSLLKLKPKIRKMEAEMKRPKPQSDTTVRKTWRVDISYNMMVLIIFTVITVLVCLSPEPLITMTISH